MMPISAQHRTTWAGHQINDAQMEWLHQKGCSKFGLEDVRIFLMGYAPRHGLLVPDQVTDWNLRAPHEQHDSSVYAGVLKHIRLADEATRVLASAREADRVKAVTLGASAVPPGPAASERLAENILRWGATLRKHPIRVFMGATVTVMVAAISLWSDIWTLLIYLHIMSNPSG